MADRGGFDPRYDPAFQRGYPDAERGSREPSEWSGTRMAEPRPQIRSAPASYVPPRVDPTQPVAADASPTTAASDPAPAEDGVDEPESPRDPRRNPFLIAVTALGIACLLVGAFWLSRTQQFFDVGAQTGGDFWIVMVSLVGAPLLLALGVAILAGVLFFLARHWQQPAG